MDSVIENKTTITKKMVYKATKLHYRNSHRIHRTLYLVAALLCAFLAATSIMYDGGISWSGLKMIFGTAVCLFFYFGLYLLYAWRIHSSITKQNPAGVETNKFYDSELENVCPRTYRRVQYQQIRRVVTSKELYILMLGKDVFFIIDKNGFTKGTNEDFMTFISDKFKGRIRKMW